MRETDPAEETVILHGISPELETELMRRARENGRDLSAEVSDIIERNVADGLDGES